MQAIEEGELVLLCRNTDAVLAVALIADPAVIRLNHAAEEWFWISRRVDLVAKRILPKWNSFHEVRDVRRFVVFCHSQQLNTIAGLVEAAASCSGQVSRENLAARRILPNGASRDRFEQRAFRRERPLFDQLEN